MPEKELAKANGVYIRADAREQERHPDRRAMGSIPSGATKAR
jgi:hypothetical protein